MIVARRAPRLVLALAGLFIAASLAPGLAGAAGAGLSPSQRATLLDYAQTTWASFVAMTHPATGLPSDRLEADGTASVQTSTTNIGAYMWSTLVAERLGIIDHAEVVTRLTQTIGTLETMERHGPSGQYYNWYDRTNGAKLTVWPPTGDTMIPHLSSVDNGWLATGIKIVATSVPELSNRARALYDSMDFGFYYQPGPNRILFHYAPSTGAAPCCYDTIVSESRIATYIGIAKGEIPPKAYFGQWRTFPDVACDWAWQETKPIGVTRTYLGVNVFEGAYPYESFRVVPGWGGSMFEALMPALFVPEEQWGPRSWAINHPLTVVAQIHHGLVEADYGYWGFSPANIPEGGYREYGVDAIGMFDVGYTSNKEGTHCQPRVRGMPAAGTRSCAGCVYERRRDAARGLPGAALRARPDAREPGQPARRLRDLRPVGVPRHGQRRHGRRVGGVPLAGPGDHHGRHRQRAGGEHAARRVCHQGGPQGAPARDLDGDVRGWPARGRRRAP